MKKICKYLIIIMSLSLIVACGAKNENAGSKKTISILKGQYSEIDIIMQMAGILIEKETDLKVKYHDSMNAVAAANIIEKKEVDLYLNYDGVLLSNILKQDPSEAPKNVDFFEYVNQKAMKERNLAMLEKFGFENTYAVVVRKDIAKKYQLSNISDLKKHSNNLVFGAEHSFFDKDGTVKFTPFNKYYDLNWKNSKSLDLGLKYSAIDSKNIDVSVAYSTDGLNKKSDLAILKDDKKFFPDYNAAFFYNKDLFNDFKDTAPNLKEILSKLTGKIDAKTMTDMNYQVDSLKKNPNTVAKKFLEDNDIIKK